MRAQRRISGVILPALALGMLASPAAVRASGVVRVGAAKTDITWHFGARSAPDPTMFEGLHSRSWARAIVFENPEGIRTAIVRTDTILITGDLHEAVAQRVQREVGIPPERLTLAATHTHVGNNGMWPHPLHGAFYRSSDPREQAMMADRIAEAVRMAERDLRPAALAVGSGFVTLPSVNRRWTDRESLGARPYGNDLPRLDPELGVLRFDDARTGKPIAVLMNYGLHPVVLISQSLVSADFVVWAERGLEAALRGPDGEAPMAMWMNGAQGDQDPIYVRYSYPEAEWTGRVFAEEAARVARALQPEPIERVAVAAKIVPLPPPGTPTPSWQPAGPRAPVTGPSPLLIPSSVRLQAIELATASARTVLLTWPGEPIRDLGVGLKQAARGLGYDNAFGLGLANDWSGYYVTPEEYDRGGYEAETFNFYGRESASYLSHHIVDLARSLAQGTTAEEVPLPPNAVADRLLMEEIARAGGAASGPLSAAEAPVPDIEPAFEAQPASIERFGAVSLVWRGGSPFVPRGWIPAVQVQLATPRGFVTVAREGTGEVLLRVVERGAGDYLWTAEWETTPDTPAGTYRFLIDGQRFGSAAADEGYTLVSDPFEVRACACLAAGEVVLEGDLLSVRARYPAGAGGIRLQPSVVASGEAVVEVRSGEEIVGSVTLPFASRIEPLPRLVTVDDVSGRLLPVTIVEPAEVGAFEARWSGPGDVTFRLVSLTDAWGNAAPGE